jgi:hypothetical protein
MNKVIVEGPQASEPGSSSSWLNWKRLSWGAIMAGVVISLVVYTAISLLGLGIGLHTLDFRAGDNPSPKAFGIGAALWWLFAGLVAYFAGGWVAGRFAGVASKVDRALHGVVTWALVTIISMFLVSTAMGGIIGGAVSIVGKGVSGAGQVAQQSGQQQQQGGMDAEQLVHGFMSSIGAGSVSTTIQNMAQNPEARQELGQAARKFIMADESGQAQAREDLRSALTAAGQSPQEAQQTLNQMEQQLAQAKQEAKEAGDTAATTTANASIIAFIAMVLGAVVSAWGGSTGRPTTGYVVEYGEEAEPRNL